jgi:hypothetical protein
MQAFESLGLWNLPDTSAPPVVGNLRVSSTGEIRLSLMGSLAPPLASHEVKELPVILGSVEDGSLGNDVTLTGCLVTRKTFGSHAGVREEYRVQRGFFGMHLSKPLDFAFRRMQLRVGGLGAWTHPLSGFRQGNIGGSRVGEEIPLLYYAMPRPVGGPIPGGEVSLGLGLRCSGTMHGHTYTERPGLIVSCDQPLSDNELNHRFIYPLQNLMTFVCDRAQEVEEVSLWREDTLVPTGGNHEIRLISERVFPEVEDKKVEPIYPHQLLFTLADIEGGFGEFVDRWLRFTTTYAEACGIFFGLQYGPPAYLDFAFLGVIESLYLYYTRRADGVEHRDREDQRLTQVLGKLPLADAEWLRGHVWSRPFPPLQDILDKLIDEHAAVMNPLLVADKWGFIREVMGTFIYTIRRDSPFNQVVNSGAELYWMMAKLNILLKACFLREVGLSAKTQSILNKNRAYQHLCQIISAQRSGKNR